LSTFAIEQKVQVLGVLSLKWLTRVLRPKMFLWNLNINSLKAFCKKGLHHRLRFASNIFELSISMPTSREKVFTFFRDLIFFFRYEIFLRFYELVLNPF
jgi:hypothetical protein